MTDQDPTRVTRSEAKAEAAAAKARAKSMRPWYKKKRFILPLLFVALIAIIAVSSGGGDDDKPSQAAAGDSDTRDTSVGSGSKEHPAADDVTITSCEKTVIGTVESHVEVVNHSSKRSNYMIEINVTDGDGTRVGEASAFVNNVDPDQKAVETAAGSLTGDPSELNCSIADVTRFAPD